MFQKCPSCDLYPDKKCDTCNNKRIIDTVTGLPPKTAWELEKEKVIKETVEEYLKECNQDDKKEDYTMSVVFEDADRLYLLQGTEALPISLKDLQDPLIHTVLKTWDKPSNFTDILDKVVIPDFNSFWIYDDDRGNQARLASFKVEMRSSL